ncbi:putative Porin [Vibrio nigripulchritudo MADA3029]|uniref:Putative Porin n=1 Tax=Vibrio nigripulchritudo TaxID=28173 RepID=U4K7N9_9VIBR|nr:porin [Vibrio nigripulchritudo]KJY69134.1 chemotaxis protein [Vibrio nigripulchritudo]CCN37868.1 putative Porin [Vibrio nigripulchritudo AM115]CCN39848.1 putative Porin [Vibrio nigripulchritudo FTn2]CCN48117.1 putative Porin [Vibrio nigripulchritudo MADA3020]CCN54968.1 putative Porin [Vibrio nigripulchritudo MADA3021]
MEKIFKRTLLGAAVASIALSGSALAKPATETVDLYGQIAISVAQNAQTTDGADKPIVMDNESRIGVRGSADWERGPTIIWQLEGGNVEDDGKNSGLGVRDTYGGFDFGDSGKVRFGRVLTPLFEVVDGYTGQSSGGGFNVGNTGNTNYDRQSNMVRYDSANLGGFSFALGAGRGDEATAGSNVYSASGQFATGVFTAKLAYENNTDRESVDSAKNRGDANAMIAGINVDLEGFGVHAAYLTGEVKPTGGKTGAAGYDKGTQSAYKFGAYYTGVEHWTFNLNFAASTDAKVDGETKKDKDQTITGQAMYSIDSNAVVYARLVHHTDKVAGESNSDLGWRLGMEYYF